MPGTVKLAEYLFTRLNQLGIGSVHGVPGDYNLDLLDYVEPAGLFWVGNANELNAGYAADGYARIQGLGALITTYGVGELSAINAIACSYTERAAVVHIVGTPPRESQEARKMVHHTLGDGDYRHFSQMSTHVTVAQANLIDSRTCPKQIDDILKECIMHSRPVYIEIPVDMVAVQVLADGLKSGIQIPAYAPDPACDEVLAKVLDRMYSAQQPIILVDGETRSLGLAKVAQYLIKHTKWPTFTTAFGKSLVDETFPNVYGIYRGSYADSKTNEFIKGSDLVLCFGPHYSSTNSYSWTSVPKTEVSVCFTHAGISIGSQTYRDVPATYIAAQLLPNLDDSKVKEYSVNVDLPRDHLLSFSDASSEEMIKQDKVWRMLGGFLRPGDIILADTGTAAYGIRDVPLPQHTRLFLPSTWLSIGYTLPACQGAALAQRELMASSRYHGIQDARTILLIGDGSFQMTVQELATIIRHNLNVVIFLINNDGYTIERCIHGLNQSYNDVSRWRYLKAPALFGAPEDVYTGSARTYGELEKVLSNKTLSDGSGLRMVEIFMERDDAPAGPLLDLINMQKKDTEKA